MVVKSSSTRIMSAASLETSVPDIPMDMPISALFNATASFTPSPVIPTTAPFCCNACEHTPPVRCTYPIVSEHTQSDTCQSMNVHQTYTPASLWTHTTSQSDIHTCQSVNIHNSVRYTYLSFCEHAQLSQTYTPYTTIHRTHAHTHLSAWEYNYFWHVILDLHHLNVTWLVDWPLQMWNTGRYRHISIHESHNQNKRRKKRRKELETNVSTRVRLTFTIFNLCRGVVR